MTKPSTKPPLLRSFIRQILFLLLFVMLFFLALRLFMRAYTHHGKAMDVPNFKEMTLPEAKKLAKKNKLKVAIDDSIYQVDLLPGQIVDQNPKPESKVKKRRTIYFVINSTTPPQISMPNLVDNSYRQAKLRIENMGLVLGKKIYEPDIAKDVVLKQLHNGKPVEPGTTIAKGETIDLVLGDGFGNTTMRIPDVVGLGFAEAQISIQDAGLKVGTVHKTETVTNDKLAMVYEQSPASVAGQTLEKGQSIDLYITQVN